MEIEFTEARENYQFISRFTLFIFVVSMEFLVSIRL